MSTAADRLAEQLDEREQEIEQLKERIEELTDDRAWRWARHEQWAEDKNDLPVPRLEIRAYDHGGWYSWSWVYCLVYRHLLGHIVAVPLGNTTCNGGSGNGPRHPLTGEIYTPFRDGAHIRNDMKQLGLRAFAIVGDDIEELEPAR